MPADCRFLGHGCSAPVFLQAALLAVLPGLAVALLRAGDVLLAVVKTTHIVNGSRHLAAIFAGLESSLWLSAAGIVFAEPSPARSVGFVVGVATGTWTGMALVHALRVGMVTVRVFVPTGADQELAGHAVASAMREQGSGRPSSRGGAVTVAST